MNPTPKPRNKVNAIRTRYMDWRMGMSPALVEVNQRANWTAGHMQTFGLLVWNAAKREARQPKRPVR